MDDHYFKQAEYHYSHARRDNEGANLAIAAALIALVERLDTLIEIAEWEESKKPREEASAFKDGDLKKYAD